MTTYRRRTVIVTIKNNNNVVVRHAYLAKANSYKFQLPNGYYQTFFYYGKGWNPNKIMKSNSCGNLLGGFIEDESFGKDEGKFLENTILTYELILQQNGNFSTIPSNSNDAL